MDRAELLNSALRAAGRPTFEYFGPNANCTLDLCKESWTAYGYRPSHFANAFFLGMFIAALTAHLVAGVKNRTWSFAACMVLGCFDSALGYAARVWMYDDLWGYEAFMVQIVCITTAPVFYCAGIYMVLAKTMSTFAPSLSRFRPSLLYRVFIPYDIVSLVVQGAGGALSARSSGISKTGINIALAGLAFQVVTLVLFCGLYIDFVVRYLRSPLSRSQAGYRRSGLRIGFGARLRIFYAFEGLAVLMILLRCAFRVCELREGYSGPLIKREGLFIGLEGVPIIVAAFALVLGHPAWIFNKRSGEGNANSAPDDLEKDAPERPGRSPSSRWAGSTSTDKITADPHPVGNPAPRHLGYAPARWRQASYAVPKTGVPPGIDEILQRSESLPPGPD